MKKGLVITLSIILGVIALMLILFWTLFGLSSVTVEFHSTTKNLAVSEKEIVEAGQFRMNACVLFESKTKSIENINNYSSQNKNFAYLRVVNIETKFPNKYIIHVVEREELFAIKNDVTNKFFVCDRDLRVLKIVDTFSSENNNAILLDGVTISNKSASVGDFLSVKEEKIKDFYSAMLENNRSFSEQISSFKSIKLSNSTDSVTNKTYTDLSIKTFSEDEFVLKNIDFALSEKIQKLFAVQSSLFSLASDSSGNMLDKDGNKIYLAKLDDGSYVTYEEKYGTNKVALTYTLLSDCKIIVDNLTLSDYKPRSIEDLYWAIVEK